MVVEEGVVMQNDPSSLLLYKNHLLTYVVHLRKRKSDHGNLKAPSTSSITYWQIEKDKKPLSGKIYTVCTPYVYVTICTAKYSYTC